MIRAALLALAVMAATQAQPQPRAIVVVPVANMFSKPSADADVVSQARYALSVAILQSQPGWHQIQTPGDDYKGWLRDSDLRPLAPNETYPAPNSTSALTANLRSHLYPEPSVTRHAPVITLPFETTLEIAEQPERENRRWLSVRLPDNTKAWIQRGDLNFDPKPLSIDQLVQLSHRFLGLPYTWGGTSSFGYDCSGFTQMLLRRAAVLMPRDAQPQADWSRMTKIDKAALQPGDLLYFGASDKKITHTAFYLGDNKFIHATTNSQPVLQVSRLDDPHWTNLLVACRRWK